MKIPNGWCRVDEGSYGTLPLGEAEASVVEWYSEQFSPHHRRGWHAWRNVDTPEPDFVGVYPTAREAFEALGVEVDR